MKITKLLSVIIAIIFTAVGVICTTRNRAEIINKIIFLDIGQGDAELIQIDGKNILIDTGEGEDTAYELSKYLNPMSEYIDYLVITHGHADHYGGMEALNNRYNILHYVINESCLTSNACMEQIDLSKILLLTDCASTITIGDYLLELVNPVVCSTSITIKPLCENCWFKANIEGNDNDDIADDNNASIVVDLYREGQSIALFAGDAEKEEEKELISKKIIEDTQILKAGHHCSQTSSSSDLLTVTTPDLVICSAGLNNKYNHPSKQTIDRFEKMGIKYYITYKSGNIIYPI